MFIQIFRNKISKNRIVDQSFDQLEQEIQNNLGLYETQIVDKIVQLWGQIAQIPLASEVIGRKLYNFSIFFSIEKTHGTRLTVEIEEEIDNNKFSYPTEFGDLAIIVEYYVDSELIDKKISILQCKKEHTIGQIDIKIHQLYLMSYWPKITILKPYFILNSAYSDEFSFYHFFLTHSHNAPVYSTVISAKHICYELQQTKQSLQSIILQYKNNKKIPPDIFYLNIKYGTNNQPYTQTPKPFKRFLKELAYLFWGTNNDEIFEIAYKFIPNIITLKIIAIEEKKDTSINPEKNIAD